MTEKRNPFTLPARAARDFRPLCPWHDAAHEELYVPVDHCAEAYTDFQAELEAVPASAQRAHTILAYGREGSGKTALLHRCASWLQRGPDGRVPADVLDFTDQRLGDIDADSRLRHICGRLIDKVMVRRLLVESTRQALQERRTEPYEAFPFLGDMLGENDPPRHLVIVLPPVELEEEIERYVTLAHPHLTLLTETTNEDVAERAAFLAENGSFVTSLSLATLSIDDGWRFVEARLERSTFANLPILTKDTVDRYMRFTIEHGGATIAQLQQVCSNVFDEAMRQTAPTITYVHFLEYWSAREMESRRRYRQTEFRPQRSRSSALSRA